MTVKMPTPELDGYFIRTLNEHGFMSAYASDRFMQAFIAFSAQAQGPVLDIGAAYGVATTEALRVGAQVIANDLDERHLEILRDRVPEDARARLTLMPGAFPGGFKFAANSLGAVLIARVLHFLDGPTIERGASKIFEWLKVGGRVFVTSETPYLKNLSAFIPTYEARVRTGEKWPGFVMDFAKIDARAGQNLPKSMHLLDPTVLRRVFEEAGFVVKEVATFARPELPESLRLDGRESVGLIAEKPSPSYNRKDSDGSRFCSNALA